MMIKMMFKKNRFLNNYDNILFKIDLHFKV